MATRKWAAEKLVNTTTSGDQNASKVVALANGRFVVVWQDGSGAHAAIRGQLFDAAGNRIGSEIAINVSPGNDEVLPSVAPLADGGFDVTWTQLVGTSNYILGSVYDSNGAFVRSQPVLFAPDEVNDSQVARLGTGTVVAWDDPTSNTGDIQYRVFDSNGVGTAVLTANTPITASYQRAPTLAASPDQGTLAIVWQSFAVSTGQVILGRLFSGSGFTLVPQFRIDADVGASGAVDPAVCWINNWEFAVTWRETSTVGGSSDTNIRARIFQNVNGIATPITDNIAVNAATLFEQTTPVITGLPNGGFVVAWQDDSGVGPDSDAAIRLQAFDASGGKIGGEFVVNTTTSGSQAAPAISALPDGRVVVTWTDGSGSGGDTSGDAVRMQIVDPRDGIVSGTPGNDTLYGNDQVNDEISGFAGNDTLIGMRGDDTLYGGDGNDVLRGGIGADVMYGGVGNDTYYVDNANDAVIENAGEGSDTVYATVNYTLSAGTSIEFLRADVGTAGLTLTGNEQANSIVGSVGNDKLLGGGGNDTLNGGGGADMLTGGAGADTFRIAALGDSTVATSGRDTILDFSAAAGDKIDLHLIDANSSLAGDQAFSFIGTNAFSGTAGQLHYAASGPNTLISGDVNGDMSPDFSVLVSGAHTFSGVNFVL